MPEQLIFDLPVRAALGRGDFFVSPANTVALAMVEDHGAWPMGKLILTGPKGAGKTHLAHVWSDQTGARILRAEALAEADILSLANGPLAVEDADAIAGQKAPEELLFHLHNLMQSAGQPLLLTARHAPARWAISLPDLASRLEAATVARLQAPDDALLHAVFLKQIADRQLAVPPKLVTYLLREMDRSFAMAASVADTLDRLAVTERRAVNRNLALKALDMARANTPE